MARNAAPRSAASRLRRFIGITLGALVILALGIYGPATLVGPLPVAAPETIDVPDIAPALGAPTLPQTGASAVATSGDEVLAHGGETTAVPLGGATKIITALVVLDAKPMQEGTPGPSIVVTAEDYAGYVGYISESARSVSLITGETWTEQQYLQAILLGSSNTHADALARWAFGSVDSYVTAANAWLSKNGFVGTTVVDATGLAEGSVGTASDLARISALAFESPVVADIMAQQTAVVAGSRTVTNLAAYRADEGITGLSRSYTDQAGLTFLFQLSLPVGGKTVTLAGAFLREPDYDTMDPDLSALVSSATANIAETAIVTQGDAFVRYRTAWGDESRGVALTSEKQLLWLTEPISHTIDAQPVAVAAKGTKVGSTTFHTPSGDVTVLLQLDRRIADPGPLWRLTHPVPVIEALIRSWQV